MRSTLPLLLLIAFAAILSPSFISCSQWTVPTAIVGTWQSAPANVTVRTEPKWMHFEFTSDTAAVTITINPDKTVSGTIGNASFTNGTLRKNQGNPDRTGIAYIVACGHINTIFPNDPVATKEVEIWLAPVNGNMEAELRLTEGHGVFPMGALNFQRNN